MPAMHPWKAGCVLFGGGAAAGRWLAVHVLPRIGGAFSEATNNPSHLSAASSHPQTSSQPPVAWKAGSFVVTKSSSMAEQQRGTQAVKVRFGKPMCDLAHCMRRGWHGRGGAA